MVRPGLPEFQPGLFLDTSQGSDWYIPFGVRHRDASLLRRVLELFMAALMAYFVPAVIFQLLDNVTAVHVLPKLV